MFEISVCSNVFCVFSLPLLFKLFPTPICSETKKGFVIISGFLSAHLRYIYRPDIREEKKKKRRKEMHKNGAKWRRYTRVSVDKNPSSPPLPLD